MGQVVRKKTRHGLIKARHQCCTSKGNGDLVHVIPVVVIPGIPSLQRIAALATSKRVAMAVLHLVYCHEGLLGV